MSINFLELVKGAVTEATGTIADLAKAELENAEKKAQLDAKIQEFIIAGMDTIGLNFFGKMAVKKLLLPHLPEFTQIIFDLIKEKIDGVTAGTTTETGTETKTDTKTTAKNNKNK